ncbi:MAG TPA: lytic transglycosylase domain-containing protein [Rhizomicrobium sp.]|nr:lytic transglycosylase domain-containing protein [Rhizomicrobium sp.]
MFNIIQQKHGLKALLAITLWGLLGAPAGAQVMDIRPDGTTAIYKGPIIASSEGLRPLALKIIAAPAPPVGAAIDRAAIHHALSPELVAAVAWQESRLQQNALSPKGARGVMQLMPGTARGLGVNAGDLSANVDGGAAYLAQMLDRFDGDIIKSLAAYNAGPEAVTRYGGVPPYPETQAYVNAVLGRLADSKTDWKGAP